MVTIPSLWFSWQLSTEMYILSSTTWELQCQTEIQLTLSLSVDARIGAIVLSNAESGVSRYCAEYTTLE